MKGVAENRFKKLIGIKGVDDVNKSVMFKLRFLERS